MHMKRLLSFLLALVLCFSLSAAVFAAEADEADPDQKPLIICIDPGHGSTDPGACATYDGVEYHEADLVLKIAHYLKEDLEQYKNVVIVMTREDNDGDPTVIIPDKIAPRVEFGVKRNADVVVSLHLNANAKTNIHGATMLISNRNYNPEVADVAIAIGDNILIALKNLGLVNRGRLYQNSQDYRNPDGSVADYYGIVRAGIWRGIPSFIVEHCYLTNEDDFRNHLSSDEKLAELAKADADGIAAYYGLEPKDGTDPLEEPKVFFLDCYGHWAKKKIQAAAEAGWVSGYPGNLFGPNDTLTRADFVTLLARMSGEELPEVTENPFSDCSANRYYAKSVQWSVDAGIIHGYDDGLFHPNDLITREQMAHIMVKYLQHRGYSTDCEDEAAVSAKIPDFANVSRWAAKDVCYCYETGLLHGGDNGFAPKDGATRAEACVVLIALDRFEQETPAPADDTSDNDEPAAEAEEPSDGSEPDGAEAEVPSAETPADEPEAAEDAAAEAPAEAEEAPEVPLADR